MPATGLNGWFFSSVPGGRAHLPEKFIMLDFIRYLLERRARNVSDKAMRSACVNHRIHDLRCLVEPDQKPTGYSRDGNAQDRGNGADNRTDKQEDTRKGRRTDNARSNKV